MKVDLSQLCECYSKIRDISNHPQIQNKQTTILSKEMN